MVAVKRAVCERNVDAIDRQAVLRECFLKLRKMLIQDLPGCADLGFDSRGQCSVFDGHVDLK